MRSAWPAASWGGVGGIDGDNSGALLRTLYGRRCLTCCFRRTRPRAPIWGKTLPELPEVETVRRGLAPALAGARLSRVRTNRADLRFPFPARFVQRLEGARIEQLGRRAKYLLARLDTGETLAMHLGMSGRFTITAGAASGPKEPSGFYYAGAPNPAHTHVIFETEAGARIEYNDPRRFGFMTLIASGEIDAHPLFKGMGPEPLGNAFHATHLARAFAGRKQSVKASLLDQRIVAGLGNIYVCEALHRARIAPPRAAGKIAAKRLEDLAQAVRDVLAEAIEAGGSSLKDYAQTDGALGYFQHRFRVYDKEGAPCPRAGCAGTVKRIVQGGRSSFYCPVCQR
jgi:formamidopyrimidine-DNA glycosylase